MPSFDSGVKAYITGECVVKIHFPVDWKGNAEMNCYQCKMFSRNNGICQLTKEISEYPLILQMKGSNTRTFFDEFTKNNDIVLTPNIELASYSLVVEFAKIGLGVGYVTKEYISNELEKGELSVIDLEEEIPSRYLGIAISKNHLPNFSAKKLMEMITKKLDY